MTRTERKDQLMRLPMASVHGIYLEATKTPEGHFPEIRTFKHQLVEAILAVEFPDSETATPVTTAP